MGEEMHAVDVIRLVCIYPDEACGGGRRGSGLARQALEALLFVVGQVYEHQGGDALFGGFEELGDFGET